MTKVQEFLEYYASLIINKDYDNLDKVLNLEHVELVNTSEIMDKDKYLSLLDKRLNNSKVKLERASNYTKELKDKGLIIYTINGETNYKVVSFVTIDNERITNIEDYWFVIF